MRRSSKHVNSVNTREAGPTWRIQERHHRAINIVAKRNGLIKENATITLRGEDVRRPDLSRFGQDGEPPVRGQTKMRLGNSNVRIADSSFMRTHRQFR